MSLSTRNIWRAMVNRCNSPADSRYADYGGRGITVCDSWLSYHNFVADMGQRPSGLTLDRIDNNKGYYKANCRWATYAENNANKRPYKKATNNSTGITGVSHWMHRNTRLWRAYGSRTLLYRGYDFFEACCARKSWEAKQQKAA